MNYIFFYGNVTGMATNNLDNAHKQSTCNIMVGLSYNF